MHIGALVVFDPNARHGLQTFHKAYDQDSFTIFDRILGDRYGIQSDYCISIPLTEAGIVIKTITFDSIEWIRILFPSGLGWSTAQRFSEAESE